MPPNSGLKLTFSECANPFRGEPNARNAKVTDIVQNGNPSAFVSLRRDSDQMEMEASPRITTRHRYSYELDKFNKNAMLVFCYDSCPGSQDVVDKVKSTFEKFRFEVELYRNADGDEVREICDTYMQQDFDEFGAIAIVVVAERDESDYFITPGARFNEKDIKEHLSKDEHCDKPKIFLTQGSKRYRLSPNRQSSFALRGDIVTFPRNLFELHLLCGNDCEVISFNNRVNPLTFLCDKVDELADQESFPKIALTTLAGFHEDGSEEHKEIERYLDFRSDVTFSASSELESTRVPHSFYYKMYKHLYLWRK